MAVVEEDCCGLDVNGGEEVKKKNDFVFKGLAKVGGCIEVSLDKKSTITVKDFFSSIFKSCQLMSVSHCQASTALSV